MLLLLLLLLLTLLLLLPLLHLLLLLLLTLLLLLLLLPCHLGVAGLTDTAPDTGRPLWLSGCVGLPPTFGTLLTGLRGQQEVGRVGQRFAYTIFMGTFAI